MRDTKLRIRYIMPRVQPASRRVVAFCSDASVDPSADYGCQHRTSENLLSLVKTLKYMTWESVLRSVSIGCPILNDVAGCRGEASSSIA